MQLQRTANEYQLREGENWHRIEKRDHIKQLLQIFLITLIFDQD